MATPAPAPLGTGSRTFRGWACVITESWDPRASNVQIPTGVRPPLKVEKEYGTVEKEYGTNILYT
ncbi:hypothetical protein FALCPG4_012064 [Fusarium falciforme]